MNSAKFSPRDLADLKHAWDFWLVSVDWQKCRGFSHSLDPLPPLTTVRYEGAKIMTTFLFSSFGARLQRCVRVIPTETGPFCEKWERTFNIAVNEFSVSGEIREGKREFRDRLRSPGSVRSIRGLISSPRNSRPD